VHREQVGLDLMLRSTAESILSRQTPYVNCATTSSYAAALPTDPEGRVVVSLTSVKVWDGTTPASYHSGCTVDRGATLITIKATTNKGTTEQLDIVKRKSGT
jgi:hypothetical protein